MDRKKRIVVLGAGFGGLRAAILVARSLERLKLLERYEVMLVDRRTTHVYTPLLYEVATTSKESANTAELRDLASYGLGWLVNSLPITYLEGIVEEFRPETGEIKMNGGRQFVADYCVIALGCEPNFGGVPGAREHARPLKTPEDAIAIRDAVWERAEKGEKKIEIIVCGGGPTGIELASELKEWCGELSRDFPACNLSVKIIQGAPTILPGNKPKAIARAKQRLNRLNVGILENQKITEITSDKVKTEGGWELPYEICIWASGTKASEAVAKMNVKTTDNGRIETTKFLEAKPGDENRKFFGKVYAVGDAVLFLNPTTKMPVPWVARTALSQADIVAHNIIEEIKHEAGLMPLLPAPKEFRPWSYPVITPVGGKYAIATIGPFVISGLVAWIMKGLVEVVYLFSIMPPRAAFASWFKGLRVFIQNDRLG